MLHWSAGWRRLLDLPKLSPILHELFGGAPGSGCEPARTKTASPELRELRTLGRLTPRRRTVRHPNRRAYLRQTPKRRAFVRRMRRASWHKSSIASNGRKSRDQIS